jgi:hypothetical protein
LAKRITVGIYIAEDDLDVLAWFNLLKANGFPLSKWVSILLIAEEIGEALDIGAITEEEINRLRTLEGIAQITEAAPVKRPQTIMFGTGNAQAQQKPKSTEWTYGWHIKAKDGTYKVGSVINISIARKNIQSILIGLRNRKIQVSTRIKALVRKYVAYESTLRAPIGIDANRMLSQFQLKDSSRQVEKGTKISAPKKEQKIPLAEEGRADIVVVPPPSAPEPAPTPPAPQKPKNPLLDYI